RCWRRSAPPSPQASTANSAPSRSEEHTSELQSRQYLVCRLLLEKKKTNEQTISACKATDEPKITDMKPVCEAFYLASVEHTLRHLEALLPMLYFLFFF